MYFMVNGKKMDVCLAMPEYERDDVLAEVLWTDTQITGEERFPAEQTEEEFAEMVDFLNEEVRREACGEDSWFSQMDSEMEAPHEVTRYKVTVEEVAVKTKVYRIYANNNDTMWEGEFTTYGGAWIKTVVKEDEVGGVYTEMTIRAENPERELEGQISDGLGENMRGLFWMEVHKYGMKTSWNCPRLSAEKRRD